MNESQPGYAPSSSGVRAPRNAYEVVASAVDGNPAIESLTLVTYQESPNWGDVPHAGESTDLPMLLKGLQQDSGERILTNLSREDASAENLREIAEGLRGNRLLGILSKVRLLGGESAHIPMMDFKCAPSVRNLEVLVNLLNDLRQGPGYVLESGRSYHYYGLRLLSEEDWKVFLGKCLLMYGYTDERYIGHQLIDGHCVLRLSAGKSKSNVPRVVAELP